MVFVWFAVAFLATSSGEVRVVWNPEQGEWSASPGRRFAVYEDLRVGVDSGPTEYLFGRITDIATDSQSNVYVVDAGYERVSVFDSLGAFVRYIGRDGEGPGEFRRPSAIEVDAAGNILVGHNGSRVSVFSPDGTFASTFAHEFPSYIRSIRVSSKSDIFIASTDVLNQKLLHVYGPTHKYTRSCSDSYAVGLDVDTRVEAVYAGGVIDIGREDRVYFTQLAPYEVRVFDRNCNLETVIYRENSFLEAPPQIKQLGASFVFELFAGSFSIVSLRNGSFINVVLIPEDQEARIDSRTVLDLFDERGTFLDSCDLEGGMYVKVCDENDRLYAIDNRKFPQLVRFRIVFR